MGVYIHGMEMPKDRQQLLWVYPNGKALTVQSDVDPWKELQAVPVPTHGRLIDADAIRADIDEKRPGRSYEDAWTLTVIDAAPTIIPATMKHKEG